MDIHETIYGSDEYASAAIVETAKTFGDRRRSSDRRNFSDRRLVMNAWRFVVTEERRSGQIRRDKVGRRAKA
ncbi:MAG: hypothetical protein OEY85_09525 [Rhodospirillales bacterium]|nr:hypothetical protein [Rhodospirillales bacterium]